MLTLHSPAFLEGGIIPTRHTGRGEDLSPPFTAKGIPEGSVSLSILLEDTSHPLFRDFPHWLIWNLPVAEHIPGHCPWRSGGGAGVYRLPGDRLRSPPLRRSQAAPVAAAPLPFHPPGPGLPPGAAALHGKTAVFGDGGGAHSGKGHSFRMVPPDWKKPVGQAGPFAAWGHCAQTKRQPE